MFDSIQQQTLLFGLKRKPAGRTFRVQEAGHSQVSFGHVKGLLQVFQVGLSVHFAHVDESGAGEQKKKKRRDFSIADKSGEIPHFDLLHTTPL